MSAEVPEGWEATTLGDVTQIVGGSTPSKAEPAFWDNGQIAWATPSDITSLPVGHIRVSDTSSKITEEAVRKTSLHVLPIGTVIMTSRATIGYPAINTLPLATNQGFANFLPGIAHDPDFLAQWLIHMRPVLEQKAGGSTFLEISKKTLKSQRIDLPPLPEQRRIAEILSSVDDAIAATQAVIDQTRTVKQGVLKRLLTKGIGHTRFKQTEIGEIPEEWEVKTLEEFCERVTDGTHATPKRQPDGVLLVTSRNLKGGKIRFDDSYFISVEDADEVDKRSKVDEGDILYGMIGTIGNPVVVRDVTADRFVIKNVALFKPGDGVRTKWLFWFLSSHLMDQYVERSQAGNAQKFVGLTTLRNAPIAVPPKQEAEIYGRIMDGFTNAEEANEEKLKALRTLKSALMSDLLMGRKRVSVPEQDVAAAE